jgi:hypothetical protein
MYLGRVVPELLFHPFFLVLYTTNYLRMKETDSLKKE